MKRLSAVFVLVALIVLPGASVSAGEPTAEQAVRQLYELVSTEPGEEIEWNRVRALFLDEAVIHMRVSRTDSALFTLDEWVGDFVAFVEKAGVVEKGFTERIVRLESTEVREVAHVFVRYEASFPTLERPPSTGIDSVHLVRVDGAWKVLSIVNEIPRSEDEIPTTLR